MYQYACLNNIASVGLSQFNNHFAQTDKVEEADGLLVRSENILEMNFPEKLLAIARAGVGVNNIPLQRCAEEGIVVFNTPGANANAVKELVLTGMLLASRGIVDGVEWVRENKDDPNISADAEHIKKRFAGTEITGKKLGIIGLGAIGVRVANAAKHLDMEVYGYDPYVSVDAAWHLSRDVHHVTELRQIYSQCDIITIHVPLMDATTHMIDAEAIAQMKDGVILINMARDLLVDEKAVLEALDSGKIRRYVSDFPNPIVAGHPGCIVIPHLGASTSESEDNCAVMAVKQLQDYLENGNIVNSVNYPSLSMGICYRASRIGIFHKNIANMITKFTGVFGDSSVNISEMANKSRGEVAYTIMDLDAPVGEEELAKLRSIDGVFRVRVIK